MFAKQISKLLKNKIYSIILPLLLIAILIFTINLNKNNKNNITNNKSLANTETLSFVDDFNGAQGTLPDASKWTFEIGGDGWSNEEREYYTNTADVASMDGTGNLIITAHKPNTNQTQFNCWYGSPCNYVSARMTTAKKFTQTYGHFEARIKMPGVEGSWPAFWMIGSDYDTVGWPASGEIDIVENYGEPGPLYVEGSAHVDESPNGFTGTYTFPAGSNGVKDWHVYAIDWTPTSINYSIDGSVYYTITSSEVSPWLFNKPFYLLLNLAIGGKGGGDITNTPSSMQMLVDYVKVSSSTNPSLTTPLSPLPIITKKPYYYVIGPNNDDPKPTVNPSQPSIEHNPHTNMNFMQQLLSIILQFLQLLQKHLETK